MSENMRQLQKTNSLWDYFSGYGYNSRFLKDSGMMTPIEYKKFIISLAMEKDLSTNPTHIFLKTEEMDNGIFTHPSFKDFFALLQHAALPLKMKRVELGLGLGRKSFTPLMNLSEIKKTLQNFSFSGDEEERWNTYFSIITQTINTLKDDSFYARHKDHIKDVTPDQMKQRAQKLETGLKDVLKGVGEYFLTHDTAWYTRGENAEKLQNTFSWFSRVFDISKDIPDKTELLAKERNMLNLLDNAIIWYPVDTQNKRKELFDCTFDMNLKIQQMQNKERKKEKLLGQKTGCKSLGKAKENPKMIKERNKITRNKVYLSMDSENIVLSMFYSLGTLSLTDLDMLVKELEPIPGFFMSLSQDENEVDDDKIQIIEADGKIMDLEDYDDDDDDDDDDDTITKDKNQEKDKDETDNFDILKLPKSNNIWTNKDEEGIFADLDDDCVIQSTLPEFIVSLYDPHQLNVLKQVSSSLKDKGFLKNFDLMGSLAILRKMEPIIMLKANELSSNDFEDKTAEGIYDEIKKHGRKALKDLPLESKMELLSCFTAATVQDLEDKKDWRSIKLVDDIQTNLMYALEGVPEYLHEKAVDEINTFMAQKCTPAEQLAHTTLLSNIAKCFRPINSLKQFVKKEDIPERLMNLKDLANQAIFVNPKWDAKQKDDFWYAVSQMGIQNVPVKLRSSNRRYIGKQRCYE